MESETKTKINYEKETTAMHAKKSKESKMAKHPNKSLIFPYVKS